MIKIRRNLIATLALATLLGTGYYAKNHNLKLPDTSYVKVIYLPADKYPATAKHIKDAESKGKSAICTIDRKGAEENRKESLKDVPTLKGMDRDEFPMAMCKEGGKGADIELISSKDNRGAGSYISHQVTDLPDGTKVLIQVK
jgi:hypothetical protein